MTLCIKAAGDIDSTSADNKLWPVRVMPYLVCGGVGLHDHLTDIILHSYILSTLRYCRMVHGPTLESTNDAHSNGQSARACTVHAPDI